MYKIVIIFVSFAVISCLHIPHPLDHLLHKPPQHMQNTTETYTSGQQINDIKAIVDNVSTALNSKDAQKYEYLITKTNEIKAGLTKLQSLIQQYNLTVTNVSKLCPGVTTFNRKELRKYITYTESKQKLFIEYLATCVDCSFVSADILKIQNLTNSYILNLNKTMDGVYCDQDKVRDEKARGIVNLNGSYFKNNLKAENWYYGSTTASDYKIYIFKRSSSYNLTNCPLETPFVKDQEQVCFDCPEGSIFNLGLQKCDTCKSDEILNIQSGQCDKCLGEKKLVKGALVCKLCVLSQGELFNLTSGKCYKCKSDSYIDTDKQTCVKIDCDPDTPRFNMATHTCEPCGVSEIVDPNDVTKCIKTNYIGLCPPSTPRYDNNAKDCVACPQDTKYNKQTNICDPIPKATHLTHVSVADQNKSGNDALKNQICQSDLRFYYPNCSIDSGCPLDKPILNTGTKQCEACPNGQAYYQDSSKCEKDVKCSATETLDRVEYTCVDTASTCWPNEVYILKINRCLPKSVTCSQHQFYNQRTQKCIAIQADCDFAEQYDPKQFKCVSKRITCKANEQYNQYSRTCQKMILCRADEELNYKLNICEKKKLKCKKGLEYFDEYQLECKPYTFITSPFAPNLIISGGINAYQNTIQMGRATNPYMKDCPLKTPYFSKSAGECISCPSQTPYFDMDSQYCTKCDLNLTYNPSSRQCQKINFTTVSPTINRLGV